MSFPDSDVIARAESRLLDPIESDHHEDCPQHPWNYVFEDPDDCECDELREADRIAAGEARFDAEREG